MRKLILPVALTLTVVLLSGCVAAIGNRDSQSASRSGATLGQQLIDLQKAKDVGAISPEEYEAQKAKLLGHTK